MRVRDVVPELGCLAADVTYGCHNERKGTKCWSYTHQDTRVESVAEVVAAPPRGLELFAAGRRRKALGITGPRATALEKLGISSVQDLLQHYPRRHVDRTALRTVADIRDMAAKGESGEVQILASSWRLGHSARNASYSRF